MNNMILKGNGEIMGKAVIKVPYKNKHITFVLTSFGPNYHKKVMKSIDSQGLLRPTAGQVISLIDLAMKNHNEPNCSEILDKFNSKRLWNSTENLSYFDGILVYDNIDGNMNTSKKNLLSLVKLNNPAVRLIDEEPFAGIDTIEETIKDNFVIAQIGEYNLQALNRVARRVDKSGIRVYSPTFSNKIKKYFSSIQGVEDILDLQCGWSTNDIDGYAYGILPK